MVVGMWSDCQPGRWSTPLIFLEEYAEYFPFKYAPVLAKELGPYLETNEQGPLFKQWLQKCRLIQTPPHCWFFADVNQKINQDIVYSIRLEAGVQAGRNIVKSDWLLPWFSMVTGACTAQYGAGSKICIRLFSTAESRWKITGWSFRNRSDFTDLHMGRSVCAGAGWIGLDATSGLFAGEGHIPLACTPDYVSAAPVVGATIRAR